MINCFAKPTTPIKATEKNINVCKSGEYISNVPKTCHSITNFIVKGNPEKSSIISQNTSLIAGNS